MISGIGTDLCSVSDIKRRLEARGQSFFEQFCVNSERDLVVSSKHPARAASLILTSKEAFAKALGTGFTPNFWWDDIEIKLLGDKPAQVSLNLQAQELVQAGFVGPPTDRVHVSSTVREDICSSFVVIERLLVRRDSAIGVESGPSQRRIT